MNSVKRNKIKMSSKILTAFIVLNFIILMEALFSPVNNSNEYNKSELIYSIVHISDTQTLAEYYPKTLNYTFQWIESRKNEYSIRAIIITGDLVDNYDDVTQWEHYVVAKSITSIPVYEVAGNHDNAKGTNFTFYETYIGSNETYYVTRITEHFMLIGISWNTTENMISSKTFTWFQEEIEANRDKYFIVATHYYMDEYKTLTPLGEEIYNKLYCPYRDNVVIVLCGHVWVRASNNRNGLHEYITNIQGANQSFVRIFKVYSNFTVVVELWRLVPGPEELLETEKYSLPELPTPRPPNKQYIVGLKFNSWGRE